MAPLTPPKPEVQKEGPYSGQGTEEKMPEPRQEQQQACGQADMTSGLRQALSTGVATYPGVRASGPPMAIHCPASDRQAASLITMYGLESSCPEPTVSTQR